MAGDKLTASRVAWTILVPFCLLLAVLAVVVIVRDNVGTSSDAASSAAAVPTVVMEKLAFSPRTLVVRSGAEVVFDNKDVAPHTVTSADEDSGVIDPGKAFRLRVDGPIEYHCVIHPSMTAKIELEG